MNSSLALKKFYYEREKDSFQDYIHRACITNSLKSSLFPFGVITLKHKVVDIHPYNLLHIDKYNLHTILRIYT